MSNMTTLNSEQFIDIINSSGPIGSDNQQWPTSAKDAMRFLWNEISVLKIELRAARSTIETLSMQPSQSTPSQMCWDNEDPVISWRCQVPSATEPDVFHTVVTPAKSSGEPDETKRTCTCKGFQYNGRCKHLNQVGNTNSGQMCSNVKVLVWRNIEFTEEKWTEFITTGWNSDWGEFPHNTDQDDVQKHRNPKKQHHVVDDDDEDDYDEDDYDEDDYDDYDEDDYDEDDYDEDDDTQSVDTFVGDVGWTRDPFTDQGDQRAQDTPWLKVDILSYIGSNMYNISDGKKTWMCNIEDTEKHGFWLWDKPLKQSTEKHFTKYDLVKLLIDDNSKDNILYSLSRLMDQSSFCKALDILCEYVD